MTAGPWELGGKVAIVTGGGRGIGEHRTHRASERTVVPVRAVVSDQEAADQIARGEVVMAGDGDQRPAQAPVATGAARLATSTPTRPASARSRRSAPALQGSGRDLDYLANLRVEEAVYRSAAEGRRIAL